MRWSKLRSFFALVAGLTAAAGAVCAASLSNLQITNQATAGYVDFSSQPHTRQSLPVVVLASIPVPSLSKTASATNVLAGTTVQFTLLAGNTGGTNAAAIPVVVNGVATALVVIRDAIPLQSTFVQFNNVGSGTPLYHHTGDPLQTYTTTAPGDLTQVDAIAVGYPTLPVGATPTITFTVLVNPTATGSLTNTGQLLYELAPGSALQALNSNPVVVPIVGLPRPTLLKTVSATNVLAGTTVQFSLLAGNTGGTNAAAIPVVVNGAATALVVIRDVIPLKTTFVQFNNAGSGTPLYHQTGDPLQTYSTTAPANLTQVDAIAVGYATLPVGAAPTITFTVLVNSNATGATSNIAQLDYANVTGGASQEFDSNPVVVTIVGLPGPTLVKTASVTNVAAGAQVQFTVVAGDTGNTNAAPDSRNR